MVMARSVLLHIAVETADIGLRKYSSPYRDHFAHCIALSQHAFIRSVTPTAWPPADVPQFACKLLLPLEIILASCDRLSHRPEASRLPSAPSAAYKTAHETHRLGLRLRFGMAANRWSSGNIPRKYKVACFGIDARSIEVASCCMIMTILALNGRSVRLKRYLHMLGPSTAKLEPVEQHALWSTWTHPPLHSRNYYCAQVHAGYDGRTRVSKSGSRLPRPTIASTYDSCQGHLCRLPSSHVL
ncbi:hypothetical protein C7974DRAFT_96578 [Boeremia exigua]|uniref:uncharacterized protein n=1 Tax=Boeremia exigua TaxID=749465 RepID=UPI001E8D390B|nr:uncharacterized protein C7974DRAFT_96578 [Boeremia exigua]KAH6642170.1 hypothetical protein C7974DRAFT_96578 [Boeremia exigua]